MLCKEIVRTDKCLEGHPIRRRCFEAASDVTCQTCTRIEKERHEKAERDRKALEEATVAACERRIKEVRSGPPELQKRDLQRQGADALEFMQVVDRAERYVQGDHGTAIVVARIEKLTNPGLEAVFLETKIKLQSGAADCRLQQLFHGTGPEGIEGPVERLARRRGGS